MQPSQFIRSWSFRLTLLYTAAYAFGLIAILAIIGTVAPMIIRHDLETLVNGQIEDLLQVYDEAGADGIESALTRIMENEDELHFRLASSSNEVLAGDLEVPVIRPGWSEIQPPGMDDDETQFARAVQLERDLWLVVAVDGEQWHDAREVMIEGAAWTLAITVPMALVCGLLMATAVRRRIEKINLTANQIREGRLDNRVPVSGTGDEFDRLGAGINAMLDSIQNLTQDIENVSVGVAHDLRMPISRLKNRLEDLHEQQGLKEGESDLVGDAIGELNSLIGTFDALLRIAQIDAGTRRAGFKKVNLSLLLNEIAETYEPVAAANGKTFEVEIDDGLEVEADQPLIVQMIVNTLENAIEHSPIGTRIMVQLRKLQGAVRLVIADTGQGIPVEEHANVFKRFYRLDRSRQVGGSGLGLSLVSSIAKLHEISIQLKDNNPGLAVEFAFSH